MERKPAQWTQSVLTPNIEISEAGSLKFAKGFISPAMAQFIADHSATLVAVVNSSQYQKLILEKKQKKANDTLAKELGKLAQKGISAEQILESMGFVRK